MAENLSVNTSKGIQPKKGVPPPSLDEHYRVTKVGNFTENPAEDADDTMAAALIGFPPRRGHIATDPSEEMLFSSVRGFRLLANCLGDVYEGNRSSVTITVTGFAADIVGSVTHVRVCTAFGVFVETDLTEGVDWFVAGNVTDTAHNLATAIDGVAGVGADHLLGVVTVTRDVGTRWFDVCASYGTDAAITHAGAYYHEARASGLGKDKRYITAQNSLNNRPTTAMDCVADGFTLAGADNFVRLTLPTLGTHSCGGQHRPTEVVHTTGAHRAFVTGRTHDKDSAAFTYDVRVATGGVVPVEEGVALTALETRLSTEPGYGAPRYVYLDKVFPIQNQAGTNSGLYFVLPMAAATLTVANAANCADDIVTIRVTTAAGYTDYVLTEGVDWWADSYTNAVAARSLCDAINLLVDGVVADTDGAVVHVFRLWTAAADTTTAITVTPADPASLVPSQETANNTLTALDRWTASSRETEATPTIIADTRWQFHSLELISTRFDSIAWRIKPRSFSLVYGRNLNTGDYVAADNARQDMPQGGQVTLRCTFVLRVEDRQYLSLMAGDESITEIYFEWEGDPIGASGEKERFILTIPKSKIVPFVKSIDTPFEDVETIIVQAEDSVLAANDFIEFRWVNAIARAKP